MENIELTRIKKIILRGIQLSTHYYVLEKRILKENPGITKEFIKEMYEKLK